MKKTIYTKEKISESVQSLLKKYHAEKAILFGSYARGEATEESDIDLIIVGGAEFEPTDVFAIAEELNRQLDKKLMSMSCVRSIKVRNCMMPSFRMA